MFRISCLSVVTCLALNFSCIPHGELASIVSRYDFPFITREEWDAQPANSVTELTTPVPLVIIHHSYEPAACYNKTACSNAMRSMQLYHQDTRGWADIGYNFATGSDGAVYEGRGWFAFGAHAVTYNNRSIGIVLIGDWIEDTPPSNQLEVTKKLIATGVDLGVISPDYTLFGHQQVGSTECPGDALFTEISSWDNFRHTTR